MNRFVALVPLLLAVLAASTLRAATVNWTASTVAAPSDVSTVGTLVGAMNVGSATAQTVNGVTFASDPTGAGTLTLGSGTVAFGNLASTFNDFWTAADPGGNAAYAAAIDTGRFGTSGSGTVTLGGLTTGRKYLVQLWIADTRAGSNARVRTVDGVSTTSGGPNLATGTFIADATTQVITVDDGANTFGPQVNLLQLRDVSLVVTTATDEFNTPSGASLSLREALRDAAAAGGADAIFFAAALSGQTITLGSEIVVNGTGGVTVDATALAAGLTVNGGAGGNRIFSIGTAGTVTLAGLNLTGGLGGGATSDGFGGAILNRGTLTLTRCTLSGNTAAFAGGAIANTASLTLRQCTLSGNTATETFGGGLYNTGSAHLLHCTVAGNTASESGGGIYHDNTGSLTLENSLVAGNFAPFSPDIFNGGTLTRVGANLVQTTVGGTLAGTGTLTEANPLLAALAANNGPTPTHATAPASPARDAAVGSAITADQRGYPLFGTADIGAYEGQLGPIAAVTVNEDTATGALPFTVGTVGTLAATSGNTALVPHANLVLVGSGGSRTLTATPAAEASGTATLTVTDTVSGETTAFLLTVTAVNDPPTATRLNDAQPYTEDTVRSLSNIVITDGDSATVTATLTLSDPAAGTLTTATAGSVTSTFVGGVWTASGPVASVNTLLAGVTFNPALNYNADFAIATSVSDGTTTLTGSKAMTGTAEADTPSVTSTTTAEDTQTTAGLVLSRNVADGAEVTHFKITAVTSGNLFQNNGTTPITAGGFITFAQGNMGLKFTSAANFSGNASFTVQASTSSGDAGLGGGTVTASITVTPVADTPSATSATTAEDTQTTAGLVLSRNAADGAEVTHFKITAITSGNLFQNNGTTPITAGSFITFAQGNAGLKFTPAANFSGNASFTVQAATSNGDAGLGGSTVTASITVNAVNDAPTATNLSAAETYTEDTSLNLTDIVITDVDSNVNATLTLSDSAAGTLSTATSGSVTSTFSAGVWTASGPVANVNTLLAGVTFTPAANYNSAFTLATSVTDGVAAALTGTKAITGTPVNDVPSFTKGADQALAAGTTAAQSVPGWATGISDGDSGWQALTFTVTETGSSGLFTVPPAVAADGTLTYTPNGTVGTATFSVTLTDDATRGGPALTSAPQTFTISVVLDYAVTTSGGVLTVTELTGGDNTLTLTQPSAGNLQFAAAGRSFSVNGGPALTGSSGSLPLAGITEVVVHAGAGNDTLNVGVLDSGNPVTAFPSLTLNGGTGNDTVNFNCDVTFAAGANLDMDLQDDDPTPGVDQVAVYSVVTLSGPGTATMKVSRNITVNESARLETADGALLLEANRQTVPTPANFDGFSILGTVRSTGAGTVTLRGTGGAGSGGLNYGIDCAGTVTSAGGDVVVTGLGGGSGSSGFNYGLRLGSFGQISAGGAGTLTVQGTGGAGSGGGNHGIECSGILTSGGGNVTITGVPGAGSSPDGIGVLSGSLTTAANGGTLTLVSDRMRISGGTLSTRLSDSVTLRPLTAGRLIDLGSTSDTVANTLGLSDAELDRITTGTLVIGDANSGAITVSAALSPANYKVLALGQNTTFAAAGQFSADLGPTAADYERLTVAGTVTLNAAAQLNLTAIGGYVPQAGDAFTLLANDGSDAIVGTFTGKPQSAVLTGFLGSGSPAQLTYAGGTGNDLVFTVLNAPPVAGADTLARPPTTRVAKVLKSALLANDTDADLDPLTLTAVGSALPAGATVALVGTFVLYTAPSAAAGPGSFTYTVSDGPGGHSVTGTVTVTETSADPASAPNSARAALVGSDVELAFLGVPGRTYGIQFTTSLTPPFVWQEFAPPADLVAPASGVLTYTDVAPGETSRFYRAVLR